METCQLGLRPYGLVGSYWYAADSLGHNADSSLYAFCANGNPVNYFDPDGRLATTAGLDESDANRSVGVFQGLCAQGVALHDAPESIADWLCGGGDCQPTRGTMTDAINAYGESLLGATDPSIHEQMEGQLLSYLITTLAIPGAGEEEMETGASASWLNNIRTTTAEEETAFTSTLNKVGTLDFSTPANGAVFYSGPGQGASAAAFAERTGAMTIEMTPGGQQLMTDPVFQSLSPGQQYQVWQAASTPFAQGASGSVNAFINGASATGTFRTIEEPILILNPNVFNYTYHY